MRIWSIHPKYLDSRGLVATWRETLLARKVLMNQTRGYRNHPQLVRFRTQEDPILYINAYLTEIYKESQNRQFKFDPEKFSHEDHHARIPVASGQVTYEFHHLLNKLKLRDQKRYKALNDLEIIAVHPIFYQVSGGIESWECNISDMSSI